MRTTAKLWLIAVLAPFIAMGAWQAHSKDNLMKGKMLTREMSRSRTLLIRDARLFLGDGNVIEQGAVLVKDGRIAEIYTGAAPDPKALKAEAIDAAGKTLLPGLIDVRIHLARSGAFSGGDEEYLRELAAYLYSGVTAVKSAGGSLGEILKARQMEASGEKLGAELFVAGDAQDMAGKHLDGVQVINSAMLEAIVQEAHKFKLPVVCHIGSARDVEDAVNAGVDGIEAGSMIDLIPEVLFTKMKQAGIAFDPALDAVETLAMIAQGQGRDVGSQLNPTSGSEVPARIAAAE